MIDIYGGYVISDKYQPDMSMMTAQQTKTADDDYNYTLVNFVNTDHGKIIDKL